ncbi:MAG: multiheme c-type cytochrome, partial [Desulfobulbaceae bacterium]|nr:multiheme c-type cytochrome [Desulfobulbaceae bacterium]
MLFDQPVLPSSQLSAKKEQAEGIMQAMRAMQYSAIGIAPHDLTAGSEFLVHLQDTYGIPFISMNLIAKKNGESIFKPYVIRQLGDISVAVLGLTDVDPNSSKNVALQNLSTLPWQDTLPKTLQEVGNSADMIILLSSFPEQINREIAQQFEKINLILQSGSSTANSPPKLTGNSLITQTASRGKYVGRIDINWTASGKWLQEDSEKQRKDIKDRLDRINWRLGRLEKKDQTQNLEENTQYRELRKTKSDLLAELDGLTQQEQQTAKEFSTYQGRAPIALPISLPEDPEVQTIVNKTKQGVYEMNKKRLTELRQKNVKPDIAATMAGWQSCRSCHPVQTEHWQQTSHAKAWETLVVKNQQFNQDCLICHVTLPTYNKEVVIRENLIASLTPEFHGVSCESCHGPGRNHVELP